MKNTTTHRGFTILETLVAIAVLTIAIIGPFYAVQSALTSSFVARDQLIASALAQEGIEYIRGIRDNNYLSSRSSWTAGLSNYPACFGDTPSGVCTIDATQGDVNVNPGAMVQFTSGQMGSIPALKISSTNLYHQQTNADPSSRFTRYVKIEKLSGTEAKITVTVTWVTAKIPYTLVLTGYIRDWL